MFKAKLHKVVKGTDYPFIRMKSIYRMIVKKRGGITPSWSPRVTQAESARAGVLVGANVESKKMIRPSFLGEETT